MALALAATATLTEPRAAREHLVVEVRAKQHFFSWLVPTTPLRSVAEGRVMPQTAPTAALRHSQPFPARVVAVEVAGLEVAVVLVVAHLATQTMLVVVLEPLMRAMRVAVVLVVLLARTIQREVEVALGQSVKHAQAVVSLEVLVVLV